MVAHSLSSLSVCVGDAGRILARPLTLSLSPEIHLHITRVLRGGEGTKP
jgi:hypothetical protein